MLTSANLHTELGSVWVCIFDAGKATPLSKIVDLTMHCSQPGSVACGAAGLQFRILASQCCACVSCALGFYSSGKSTDLTLNILVCWPAIVCLFLQSPICFAFTALARHHS